jgi:hypothetical protein
LTTSAELLTLGERLDLAAGLAPRSVSGRELQAALALRHSIHTLFAAIASGGEPDAEVLEVVLKTKRNAVKEAELVRSDARWRFAWSAVDPRRVRFSVLSS